MASLVPPPSPSAPPAGYTVYLDVNLLVSWAGRARPAGATSSGRTAKLPMGLLLTDDAHAGSRRVRLPQQRFSRPCRGIREKIREKINGGKRFRTWPHLAAVRPVNLQLTGHIGHSWPDMDNPVRDPGSA